jgi:hypothetical protein
MERRALHDEEGAPFVPLLVSAAISFVFLAVAPWVVLPILSQCANIEGDTGPLAALPVFMHNPLLEALVGAAVLTIIGLAIHMAQRHSGFSNWLPLVLSVPVALVLILPSALEHGGPLQAWLIFAAMVGGVFCLHWLAFTWGRAISD